MARSPLVEWGYAMLAMRGITKRFGPLLANDRIDFSVAAGEIHALLGENGAGKSTLMNQLYGLYRPDAGEIWFAGKPVTVDSPRTAIALGIGMVHQHPMLVPQLSATENIVAGLRQNSWPLLNLRRHAEEIGKLARRYGFTVPLDRKVADLPVGLQKQVEVLKVIYRGARLIVLDEPTDVLSPQDIELFTGHLRSLVAQGHAVVFISHHLEEVTALADRITVLRGGRVAGELGRSEASVQQLATLMVGELPSLAQKGTGGTAGAPVLKVAGVQLAGPGGRNLVAGMDLEISGGEVLGIAGVAGNGQDELVEMVAGIRRPTSGTVHISGRDVHQLGVRRLIDQDLLGYIPAERRRDGLVLGLSVAENLVVDRFWRPAFSRRGILRRQEIRRFALEVIRRFNVRPPGADLVAGNLSGGNQQKLVLARVITRHPNLIVAVNPSRGLDIGATHYVRSQLLAERDRGAAILLISYDLEELLQLSDRLAVMFRGELMGTVRPDEVSTPEIGLMMGGQRRDG